MRCASFFEGVGLAGAARFRSMDLRLRNHVRLYLPALLRGAVEGFQVDAQLLALLVKMATFKAECFRSLRNMFAAAFQFGQYLSALEGKDALGEWPCICRIVRHGRNGACGRTARRKCGMYGVCIDFALCQ